LEELKEQEGKTFWRGMELHHKTRRTSTAHKLVSTKRDDEAVRHDVIASILAFVDERLVIEPFIRQMETVFGMKVSNTARIFLFRQVPNKFVTVIPLPRIIQRFSLHESSLQ
jgi:hypothetical protein